MNPIKMGCHCHEMPDSLHSLDSSRNIAKLMALAPFLVLSSLLDKQSSVSTSRMKVGEAVVLINAHYI